MSKINGDKARTAAEKRRRITQRAKDRVRKAAAVARATQSKSSSVTGATGTRS